MSAKSRIKGLYSIFILLAFLFTFPASSSADQYRVTKVYDGDTLKAEMSDSVIYIMLLGIDAPEVPSRIGIQGQPFAKEAKELLSSLVLNKTVKVEGYGMGPYPDNNIISVIFLKDKNINLEMVKSGLAEAQRENFPKNFDIAPYIRAEKQARESKKGMWALGNKYISPKEWRKRYQEK